jgi:hypothetical protein
VSSAPGGINCGAACSASYNYGTTVVLTATPGVGSVFSGWSGGGCSGTGTCSVTLTAATTVTATFTLATYVLTVNKTGGGSGSVNSAPAGITCGTTCASSFSYGTNVVLSAGNAFGSTFTGWSGGGCSGTGNCTVPVTAATTVSANFELTQFSIGAGWNCASLVSCIDLYDFTFPAETTVTIQVGSVTGNSVVRLGAWAPGVPYSGQNLLTGRTMDRMCVAQNTSDTVLFRAIPGGTYRIGVGRDWGMSGGAAGTYSLTVFSSSSLVYVGTSNNDIPPGTASTGCGYSATFSSGWNCAFGINCQDVYSFDTLVSTTANVVAIPSASSAVRLAVFDGAAVNTTNRLNGLFSDRRCSAAGVNDAAAAPALPVGGHLFAVGRDWGFSSGAAGTYTYTITTPDAPLVPRGQTLDDTASQAAGTTCP